MLTSLRVDHTKGVFLESRSPFDELNPRERRALFLDPREVLVDAGDCVRSGKERFILSQAREECALRVGPKQV